MPCVRSIEETAKTATGLERRVVAICALLEGCGFVMSLAMAGSLRDVSAVDQRGRTDKILNGGRTEGPQFRAGAFL